MQEDGKRNKIRMSRSTILLVIVSIIAIAVFAVEVQMPRPECNIVSWNHSGTLFTINVTNHGRANGTAIIHCEVKYSNGDTYRGSQTVTLEAGESMTVSIQVSAGSGHIGDNSGGYYASLS